MKLLTKEVLNAFEKQGDTSNMKPDEIKIIAKFFNPVGRGTWYCYEYDTRNRIFWGYVNLGDPQFAECGTISLDELEGVRLLMGLGIERDRHFGDYTLQEVIDKVEAGVHV